MSLNKRRRSGFPVMGAIGFFLLVALIIQVAILVYDYIIARPEIERPADNGLIALLMLAIVLILATFCTVTDIIRRKWMVDRPVEQILSATERIAAGDLSVRLTPMHPYGHYDEFDVIMENLNVMAAALGHSEILKEDFISNVSHELKTPLSVIRSYATLLGESDLSEEERQRYARTLSGACERLAGLITNILQLNKLENRELRMRSEPFDLTEALAQSVLQYEERIEQKELELTCELAPVTLCSCRDYLDLVWSNLLSNAIKFTEPGGRISVHLKREGERAVVTVTDSGCGISPEVGARIFEKFYQVESSHTGEGNGLGLALVKRVIDMLGGEITVKSELGKGSSFTVVLTGAVTDA